MLAEHVEGIVEMGDVGLKELLISEKSV